jgi:hypothetical protein
MQGGFDRHLADKQLNNSQSLGDAGAAQRARGAVTVERSEPRRTTCKIEPCSTGNLAGLHRPLSSARRNGVVACP